MNAREKLNMLYIGGSFMMAVVVGVIFQSWLAFAIAVVVLIGIASHSEQIRM